MNSGTYQYPNAPAGPCDKFEPCAPPNHCARCGNSIELHAPDSSTKEAGT